MLRCAGYVRKLIVKASVSERLPRVLSRYPASTISWLCLPRKNVQSFPGSALIMWLCESLKQNFTLEGFSAALVICGSTRRIFASRGLQSWDNHQPRECGAWPASVWAAAGRLSRLIFLVTLLRQNLFGHFLPKMLLSFSNFRRGTKDRLLRLGLFEIFCRPVSQLLGNNVLPWILVLQKVPSEGS